MKDRLKAQLKKLVATTYRVQDELGRGATAVVYKATRRRDNTPVAIKLMDPEITMELGTERFRREIRVGEQLHHPNIVAILDHGESGHLLYHVMEYVDGETLRDRMHREPSLDIAGSLHITRAVAAALAYAHAHGVIHRDIKPSNILLNDDRVLVADFGLARAILEGRDEFLTAPGVALGTPEYMSPEQARGTRRLDGRTDIYSLACVAYELLCGSQPFSGASRNELMVRRIMDDPPHVCDVRPDVPLSIDQALCKAMATNPEHRFSSAAQFVEALTSL